jgi:hypothetical protein
MLSKRSMFIIGIFAATAVSATDLLPLKNGIYVPARSACRGASRAEMINYWGGRSSIGSAMATCEIKKISHRGHVYTYKDVCTDIQSGEAIVSDATTLTVLGPASFRMNIGKDAATYKYCGARPQ